MNEKLGIITFHHVANYGALLQAYALQNFLNSSGYEVETIDYRPMSAIKYYIRELLPLNKKMSPNKSVFKNWLRAWKIRRFLLKNVTLTEKKIYRRKKLADLNSEYKVLITGSDQIWCLDSFRGYDPSYFLDFADSEKTRKISYAPSFGSTMTTGKYKEKVSELLKSFSNILVRDTNSKNIVSSECEREASVVLDPTFLIEYSDIKSPVKVPPKYLLIYNQASLSAKEEKFVQKVAELNDLTIVSVGKHNRIANLNFTDAGIEEWITLYRKSSYVITNAYHGTIFSIIFRKQFTVLLPKGKTNKVVDLLCRIGLEKRIINKESTEEKMAYEIDNIDYEHISQVVDKEVLLSKKRLLGSISGSQVEVDLEQLK